MSKTSPLLALHVQTRLSDVKQAPPKSGNPLPSKLLTPSTALRFRKSSVLLDFTMGQRRVNQTIAFQSSLGSIIANESSTVRYAMGKRRVKNNNGYGHVDILMSTEISRAW